MMPKLSSGKRKNQPLRTEELPKWANSEENTTFVGWSYQGKTYTNEELLQLEFSEDTQLTAVFKQKLTRIPELFQLISPLRTQLPLRIKQK